MERHNVCMQTMQIFTAFLFACECLSSGKIHQEGTTKKSGEKIGTICSLQWSLCAEDKIFHDVVLLVKDFANVLSCLAAQSKESLKQSKKNNAFSVISDSPRTANPGICSFPKLYTLLLLEFPTLATECVQLLDKQLLSCCSSQVKVSFRLSALLWPASYGSLTSVMWAAEHIQKKDEKLREEFGQCVHSLISCPSKSCH